MMFISSKFTFRLDEYLYCLLYFTEEGKDRNDNSKDLPPLPTSGPLLPTTGPLLPTSGPLLPTSGALMPTSAPSRQKTSSECSYEPEDTYEMPSWERPIVQDVTAHCVEQDSSYLDVLRGSGEEENSDVAAVLPRDLEDEEGSLTHHKDKKKGVKSGKEEWSWNNWWPPWRRRLSARDGGEDESGGEVPVAVVVSPGAHEEEDDYIIPSPLPSG